MSTLLRATIAASLLLAADAHAAPPKDAPSKDAALTPVQAADLSGPYHDRPEVDHARKAGLDASTLATLSQPDLPADLRVAVIHAAHSRRPSNKSHAQVFARHLTQQLGKERMTLARLSVPDLLTLGYMTALEAPATLQRKGGATEVERAAAPVLLTAAVNRNRGDLSIALIDALLKAQIAVTSPDQRLCDADACVDQVLENYPDEWSMRPAAVCALVAAIPRTNPDGAGARLCAAYTKGDARAPVYAEGAISPSDQAAGRFSQPTHASPWAALGGMPNLPPGQDPLAMVPQMMRAMLPPPSSPEEAFIYELLIRELEAQAQQLGGAAYPPGFNPFAPQGVPQGASPFAPQGQPHTIDLNGGQPADAPADGAIIID